MENLQGADYYRALLNSPTSSPQLKEAARNWLARNTPTNTSNIRTNTPSRTNTQTQTRQPTPTQPRTPTPTAPTRTNQNMNTRVMTEMRNDPYFEGLTDADMAMYADAMISGNFSNINFGGMPFDARTVEKLYKEQRAVLDPAYAEEKRKETTDIEDALGLKQREFERYLASSGSSFEGDKMGLDLEAAKQGVLFSGGRKEKERNLKSMYEADLASKRDTLGTQISSIGRDYQNKYGGRGGELSQYFKLGSQSYNPNVARGGVSSTGLSSVYNPLANIYSGSNVRKQNVEAAQRAFNQLRARGQKVTGNYNN